MSTRKLIAALIAAAAVSAPLATAHAAEGDYQDVFMLFKMSVLDKNKDGMVSKKEFMAMVEKAYDMKVKEMKARGGIISEADMQALLKSLYYVGGN